MNAPHAYADLARAMQAAPLERDTQLDSVRAILATPLADRRPWMLYGIAGSAGFFALAVLGALRAWPEALTYLLAIACLAALGWGAWRGSIPRRRHRQAMLGALAELPLPILARATVSTELAEPERVLIVNFLNATYPGWTVDLEAADEDWQKLKDAKGVPGGCGRGCGSRCG